MLINNGGTDAPPTSWLPPAGDATAAEAGLTREQTAEAEAVARRLHGELRAVLNALPPDLRGASALARELSLDRATCQRVVGATADATPTPAMLVKLPGIAGLRQFLAAVEGQRRIRSVTERVAAAGVAVDKFEALLDHLNVSQRGLRARLGLDAGESLSASTDSRTVRENLFRSAAAAVGRWSSATLEFRIIRPCEGDADKTEGVRVRAMVGHVASPSAVPLELGAAAHLQTRSAEPPPPAFSTLDGEPASGDSDGLLLKTFCSTPLPRLTSRNVGSRVVHVVDLPETSLASPADVVLGTRSTRPDRHPATMDPPVGEMWHLINFPARRLVFDIYLHHEIARRSTPSIEAHLWGPDVTEHGSSRWSTRIPGGPQLQVLRPLDDGNYQPTPAYARYAELAAHAFTRVGWRPRDFVGYRCEVEYPLWRAGYCMAFDFAQRSE